MSSGKSALRSWVGHGLWLVATLLLALIGAEIFVRALDLFPVPRGFSRGIEGEDGNSKPEAENEETADRPVSLRVPHPYLGWVNRPQRGRNNAWGFPSDHDDYRDFTDEDFVVAVTGGSVALGVAILGKEGLFEGILKHRPELEGRLRLVTLALGGYKQPQQYIGVSQALLLGVPIDAVINLDGFNEAALGTVDARRKSHPIFPRLAYWNQANAFYAQELTTEQIEATAGALQQRRKIAELSSWLEEGSLPTRFELVRALVGTSMLKAQMSAVAQEEFLTGEQEMDPGTEQSRGAASTRGLHEPCYESESKNCDEEIVRLWKQSSLMLADLCRSQGITYLHALQPNQYVAPAKKLTEEELAKAWAPDHIWSRTVVRLFPVLRRVGEGELRAAGIDFLDLTPLFEHETDTVYTDTCCHFNEPGYNVIGRAMGEHLSRALGSSPARETSAP